VDVMLVLLIIFLITIPVVTTSVPVELPKETVEVRDQARESGDLGGQRQRHLHPGREGGQHRGRWWST
jgi:biopolymer transport protein ExbD